MEPQNESKSLGSGRVKREYRVPDRDLFILLALLGAGLVFGIRPVWIFPHGEAGWVLRGIIAPVALLVVILLVKRFMDRRKTPTPLPTIIPPPHPRPSNDARDTNTAPVADVLQEETLVPSLELTTHANASSNVARKAYDEIELQSQPQAQAELAKTQAGTDIVDAVVIPPEPINDGTPESRALLIQWRMRYGSQNVSEILTSIK